MEWSEIKALNGFSGTWTRGSTRFSTRMQNTKLRDLSEKLKIPDAKDTVPPIAHWNLNEATSTATLSNALSISTRIVPISKQIVLSQSPVVLPWFGSLRSSALGYRKRYSAAPLLPCSISAASPSPTTPLCVFWNSLALDEYADIIQHMYMSIGI
ncbi:hypothetical protein WG66_010513 [Moniliophthora roreri]|nr:hypothetical protein WG66_010513 [Moniliophthora roreri]